VDEELLEVEDLFAETGVAFHFGERVNVVHAIQPIEGDRVAEEVIALECRVDAKDAITPHRALNVVMVVLKENVVAV
jgi:hypothetical protein